MANIFETKANHDFVGFSYGKWHCIRDGHVYRTSDGSRYNSNLIPTLTDKTVDIPSGDGQYYFQSYHKNRTFTINFAFDELSELDVRNLRKVFNGKEVKELIFDEQPYKAYDAKVTGTPALKTICFDNESGERVYKGEGTVQFTCYCPYAHTPNWVYGTNFQPIEADGRLQSSYNETVYTSKSQWLAASGLTDSTTTNVGDLDAPFMVSGFAYGNEPVVAGATIKLDTSTSGITVNWDSRTGLVVDANNPTTAVKYTGNSCATIPVGGAAVKTSGSGTLDYEYWYY